MTRGRLLSLLRNGYGALATVHWLRCTGYGALDAMYRASMTKLREQVRDSMMSVVSSLSP